MNVYPLCIRLQYDIHDHKVDISSITKGKINGCILQALSCFNDVCFSVLMTELKAIATGLAMTVDFGSSHMLV